MVCCSGIKLYMKCVALVYTDDKNATYIQPSNLVIHLLSIWRFHLKYSANQAELAYINLVIYIQVHQGRSQKSGEGGAAVLFDIVHVARIRKGVLEPLVCA